MAQAYAAVLGILLTVGLAFTQLGEYRIPVPLLIWLSRSEALAFALAGSVIATPVVALTFGVLELHRLCFLLFLAGLITLPVFIARMIERTRPAFYVHRLAKTKRGWRVFQDAVVTLATQAADKRDWDGLAMMVALLGQLREPDPRHNLERGWGYQYGLPRVIRHLVETDNDRGLREVLGTIAHGACVTRTTWILDLDETRGRFENWLRLRWLMRPAWAHRIEARLKGGQPLLVIPRSYDYGILMGLTSCMNTHPCGRHEARRALSTQASRGVFGVGEASDYRHLLNLSSRRVCEGGWFDRQRSIGAEPDERVDRIARHCECQAASKCRSKHPVLPWRIRTAIPTTSPCRASGEREGGYRQAQSREDEGRKQTRSRCDQDAVGYSRKCDNCNVLAEVGDARRQACCDGLSAVCLAATRACR